jgi:hypothetical protein
VIPYNKLAQTVKGTQLINPMEAPLFLKSINHACLILGIITLVAIIPAFLGSRPEKTKIPKNQK